MDYLRDAGIPRVIIDPIDEQHPAVTTVHLDNQASTRRAVEHLIGLGHTEIAVVSGNPHTLPARERLTGFCEALDSAGLPVREEWHRQGGFDRAFSEEAMRDLMTMAHPPTAVVFASDKGALGGYAAAAALGGAGSR